MHDHETGSRIRFRHAAALLLGGIALAAAMPASAQACYDGIVQRGVVTSPLNGSFQYVGQPVALQAAAVKMYGKWVITGPNGTTTLPAAPGAINWTPTVAGSYSANVLMFAPTSPAPGQVSNCLTGGPFSFVVTNPPVYIKPKYQVVGVYYSPPGAKSTATYSAGFTSGTSTNVSSSFTVATQVSLTGGWQSLDKANSASGTVTGGWSQEKDNSSQITIGTQESTGTVVPGPLSSTLGVDHDYDIIWVWLNPELSLSPLATQIMVNGYSYDANDPVAGADIVPIYVGELKGTLAIPSDLQYRLQRPWDTTTGALTAADYTNILAADPFAVNPSFNPNADTSGRYERPRSATYPNGDTTAVNYIPAPVGAAALCYPYSFTATSTSALGQGAKDTRSVGFSVDAKYSSTTSYGILSAETKASTTLTTSNSWSQSVSSGSSQSAAFQICGPLATDNYTGYSAMQVWKDNVYGTFMFFPVP